MSELAATILYATSPAKKTQVEFTKIDNLFTGMLTGMATKTLTSPFDVVKVLIQVNTTGGNAKDTIAELWKNDGIAAFWRGNFAGCLQQGPQSALKFFVLEELRKRIGHGNELTPAQRTFMGGIAGIVSQATIYPLDFVHTRIMIDPKKYTSLIQAFGVIIKEEGPFALWGGIAPTILGAIPFEGAQFFAYDGLCQLYREKTHKQITPVTNCVIGAVAGAFSQTIAFPFDVVRKRMIAAKKLGNENVGMMGTFVSIYQNEGITGYFRGLTINMVKIIPYSALQYTLYAEFKKAIINIKSLAAEKSSNDQKKK